MEAKSWDSFLEAYQKLLEERDIYRDLALFCYGVANQAAHELGLTEDLELIQQVWRKLDGTSISDSKPRDESLVRK